MPDLSPADQLRDAAVAAICVHRGSYTWETIADLVLATVRPELDRLKAEVTAIQDRTYTECANGMREHAEALPDGDPRIPGLLDAAHILIAARTAQES